MAAAKNLEVKLVFNFKPAIKQLRKLANELKETADRMEATDSDKRKYQ